MGKPEEAVQVSLLDLQYPPLGSTSHHTVYYCFGAFDKDSAECRICRRSMACFVKTANLKEDGPK